MTGTAGEDGVEATSGELIIQKGINLGFLSAVSVLAGNVVADLLFGSGNSLSVLGRLALTKGLTVVGLIPLTERSGINLDDGTLHESLCADQLVVAGIVDDINQTGLAGDGFATPAEVSRVEAESAVLVVTTTDTDKVNALGAGKLGVGSLASELELSLLAVVGAFSTGSRALVAAITRNAYMENYGVLVTGRDDGR